MLQNALDGITVLDFSQGIAGPSCARNLAEMGAKVIKIEPPAQDWARRVGNQFEDTSVIFEVFNRGKSIITLDLKSQDDLKTAKKLIKKADVLIENYRPGVISRLGLCYKAVSEENSQIIFVSISGFGQTGAKAHEPATDSVMQAYTGLVEIGALNNLPKRIPLAIVDVATGIYAGQAVLAALIKRSTTGRGEYLDINLAHAMASFQEYKIADELMYGRTDQEALPLIGLYRVTDGSFVISTAHKAHEMAVLEALDCLDILECEPFTTEHSRRDNQQKMRHLLNERIKNKSVNDCVQKLKKRGVPCQRVYNYQAFIEDPHIESMGILKHTELASGKKLISISIPGLKATSH